MPTDWPRIQSASKLSTVSTAVRRSAPLPWITTRLRAGSTRTVPALAAKLSSSLMIVWRRDVVQRHDRDAEPGSARSRLAVRSGAAADGVGGRNQPIARGSRTSATSLMRSAFSSTKRRSVLGTGRPEASVTVPCTRGIDRVADAENVAEDDLGDRRDRRVLEIEFVAVAAGRRRGRRRRHGPPQRPPSDSAVAGRDAAARRCLGRLRKARQQIDGADLVERRLWRGRIRLDEIAALNGRQPSEQHERGQGTARQREERTATDRDQ